MSDATSQVSPFLEKCHFLRNAISARRVHLCRGVFPALSGTGLRWAASAPGLPLLAASLVRACLPCPASGPGASLPVDLRPLRRADGFLGSRIASRRANFSERPRRVLVRRVLSRAEESE